MKTNKKIKKFDPYAVKLDAEEQALLKSYEKGEWKSVPNLAREMKLAKEIATNTLRKDARITLRISNMDLVRLKEKAAYKGLPYQTFISSVLHEYAAGHFEGCGVV
jgi:predicted DNA binding CopG/RHH family protein